MMTRALLRSRSVRTAFLLFLLSGIAHAADDTKRCTYIDVADLPIRYTGEGLIPAVDGTINGTPAVMLVDTGTSMTALTMNAVTRRDINPFMTGRWIDGFAGSSRLYSARLKDFRSARRTAPIASNWTSSAAPRPRRPSTPSWARRSCCRWTWNSTCAPSG
jgi:hypothetical protein